MYIDYSAEMQMTLWQRILKPDTKSGRNSACPPLLVREFECALVRWFLGLLWPYSLCRASPLHDLLLLVLMKPFQV